MRPSLTGPDPLPPRHGQLVLACFMNREQLEAAMNRLNQDFLADIARHGAPFAHYFYWSQVFRTAFDQAWPPVQKLLGLAELLSRFTSGL